MKLLEEKIRKEGTVLPGDVLKVGSFINQQMDVPFLCLCADELVRLYEGEKITKVLTVEASGIGFACLVAERLGVPALFAKKSRTSNVSGACWTAPAFSYTHGVANTLMVPSDYLTSEDRVLIVDDFLATGSALKGLVSICGQAGAHVCGCGILIEKAYQSGGEEIRAVCRVESLARISEMSETRITFI